MNIIDLVHVMAYHMCDAIYGLILKNRGHKNITDDELSQVKEIEASAYPDAIRGYENLESVDQLLGHIGCFNLSQIDLFLYDDCYLLLVNHFDCIEMFDLAALEGRCKNPIAIWNIISQQKRTIRALCREKTTYRMLKKLEKKNKIVLYKDLTRELYGEEFHSVRFKFVN